jgi:flavorubredoxin
MYGNTEKYMNAVAQGLAEAGMPVEIFDVARVHASHVSAAVLKYRGILLGVPTYEAGLFPPMAHQLDIIERKKMKNKVAGIFGSYLWSGGAQKEFRTFAEQLKWSVVEAEEFKGGPYEHELDAAFAFGKKFAADVDAVCS